MDARLREERLEFCRLVGAWYLNNQCTEAHPWGPANSADLGRFVYQYCPSSKDWRGNPVWGQATAAMALLALAERLQKNRLDSAAATACREAALAAGGYMSSLQILDQRNQDFFGAFRQSHPQSISGNPRDGATGCMGLCTLYRYTGDEEWLYRARLFADWYIRIAMRQDQWPCYTYRYDERGADVRPPELWQAGGALALYYVYRLTGEKRYIEEGMRPIMDRVKREFDPSKGSGNDDFASTTAMAACLAYDDPELVEWLRVQLAASVAAQQPDGAVGGLDGTPVLGLNTLNFADFIAAKELPDDPETCRAAAEKAAQFLPTLQETSPADLRSYGGLYGQTQYGVSRSLIHQRPAGYAILFMLRVEGGGEPPPGYNVFGW